jgi:hypothetical protein
VFVCEACRHASSLTETFIESGKGVCVCVCYGSRVLNTQEECDVCLCVKQVATLRRSPRHSSKEERVCVWVRVRVRVSACV